MRAMSPMQPRARALTAVAVLGTLLIVALAAPAVRPPQAHTPPAGAAPVDADGPLARQETGPRCGVPPSTRQLTVSDQEVLRGPSDRAQVSLVINAGSGYPPAEELLDILASRQVCTTFFIMGWWAERNPGLVARIHAEGHEIASHGYKVFDLTKVSTDDVRADLEHAEAVISGITGQTTRPLWSPSAGYRDARVRGVAAELGYRPILWTQDSGDWRTDATAAGVLRRSLSGAANGSIIVLHLDSPRSHTATAAVLGELIDTLRARGLEPVTITELIGD